MIASHRILPHPSDIGFAAEADSFTALLGEAVLALADIETGGQIPTPDEERPLTPAQPDTTPEERVVDVLEQCLVWLDTDDWLATGVDATGEALVGAPLTSEARETGTHVKAITWHQLAVCCTHRPDGTASWSAIVFVDL